MRLYLLSLLLLAGCPDANEDPGTGAVDAGTTGACVDGQQTCHDNEVEVRCVGGNWVRLPCNEGERCGDGACRSVECEVGAQRCENGVRQRCRDGFDFTDDPCSEVDICIDGACVPRACDPGRSRCNGIGVREFCAGDGSAWNEAPCEGQDRCVQGRCEQPVCEPDTTRCIDDAPNQMQQCNGLGAAWEVVDCDEGMSCEDGACLEQICFEGETGCFDASTRGLCNADGTAYDEGEACPEGNRCSRGFCIDPCDEARGMVSYDGCRFFAVDLPQIGEVNVRQDEHPFAVVLSNPSEFPGRVTVTRSGEQIVDMVASQVVTYTSLAGTTSATANSFKTDANGRRTNLSGAIDGIEIPAGGMVTLILPNASAGTLPVVRSQEAQFRSELRALAYRVDTTVPVTAYQFQPICCSHSYTADASILIPAGSLGEEYYAVSSPHFDFTWQIPLQGALHESLPGFISIVASDRETQVRIDLANKAVSLPAGMSLDNNGVLHAQLRPYDVLTLITQNDENIANADLTGVHITATEEVAVFGGHTCTYLPHGVMACDHIESLNMPVETWRDEYLAARTVWRGRQTAEMNYYRIQVKDDATDLTFDPPLADIANDGPVADGLPDCRHMGRVPQLNAGEWCEFGSRSSFHLRGSGPIALTQTITSALTAGGSMLTGALPNSGDPAMSAIPPVAQYRNQYSFLLADTYELSYAVLLHRAGAIMQIDGVGVNAGEMGNADRGMYLLEGPTQIGSSAWFRTVVRLPAGPHEVLDMLNEEFGLMVHAYDDNVSYAYPGGMNMTKAP
jgi:hypothetical protein